MKTNWTEQDLRLLARQAEDVFEDVGLTKLPAQQPASHEEDGMHLDYQLRGGQVQCVLRRFFQTQEGSWELRMTAPLAGSVLPEDRMGARERELCREALNHDFVTGVYNRRYCETVFCTQLDTWADEHRGAALALVELDGYAGQPVPEQLACFVANQWKKLYDTPGVQVVCRVEEHRFLIGCADKTCAQLQQELCAAYAAMPHECVLCGGMLRRLPFTLTAACAGTEEIRGKNWAALYGLCVRRLEAALAAGGDQVYQGE